MAFIDTKDGLLNDAFIIKIMQISDEEWEIQYQAGTDRHHTICSRDALLKFRSAIGGHFKV